MLRGIQLLQHTIYRYRGPVWVDDIDPVWISIAARFDHIDRNHCLVSDSTFGVYTVLSSYPLLRYMQT